MVSIHAPTRGATVLSRSGIRPMVSFNPRTHTGCDKFLLVHNLFSLMFQSTHPHGVRHICTLEPLPPSGFNPRTHTGCDTIKAMRKRKRYRFQSTHPHGVRRYTAVHKACAALFQSTHPHGVRPISRICAEAHRSFNPRTHTGCDMGIGFHLQKHTFGFNPRTHTGCDKTSFIRQIEVDVSIHAPTRGATPCSFRLDAAERVSIHAPTRGATNSFFTDLEAWKVSIHAPTRGATRT